MRERARPTQLRARSKPESRVRSARTLLWLKFEVPELRLVVLLHAV